MKYITYSSLFYITIITGFLASCSDSNNQNWRNSTLTTFDRPGKSIRAIQGMNDSTVIYAANDGQVGYTHDLGKSWQEDTLTFEGKQPNFRAIAKTNENLFLLSIESPAILYRMNYDRKDIVYTERDPNAFYNAMDFIDNKNGIAFGDAVNGCFSILLTKDSGRTWKKLPCSQVPDMHEGEVAFAASNSNIASYKDHVWLVTGGSISRILHSKDKGKHWEVFETPILHGGQMTGIYSVDFYDKKIGIIAGGDYSNKANNKSNKAISTDGGKTWNLVADNQLPGFISCVKFVPNSDGKKIIAAGADAIYLSEDQGKHWEAIHSGSFHVLQFVNHNTLFLGGENKVGVLKLNQPTP